MLIIPRPRTGGQYFRRAVYVLLLFAGLFLLLISLVDIPISWSEGTFSSRRLMQDLLLCFGGLLLTAGGILVYLKEMKNYRLRYLFSKKEFEAKLAPAEALYAADAEERKQLRTACRRQYNQTGDIFLPPDENCWILTDKNGISAAEGVVEALLSF